MTAALRRAVFLDRDGTINREQGFVAAPGQLVVLPGVAEAVRRLDAAGWPVVVVTNQSGVARGLYGEADVARVHEAVHRALGGVPRGYFHCPHLAEGAVAGFAHPCACRKPGDGLLLRAARVLSLELAGSCVIGDSARDLLMARAHQDLARVLVQSGKPWREQLARLREHGCEPHAVVKDLAAAADWLLARG